MKADELTWLIYLRWLFRKAGVSAGGGRKTRIVIEFDTEQERQKVINQMLRFKGLDNDIYQSMVDGKFYGFGFKIELTTNDRNWG